MRIKIIHVKPDPNRLFYSKKYKRFFKNYKKYLKYDKYRYIRKMKDGY